MTITNIAIGIVVIGVSALLKVLEVDNEKRGRIIENY